MKTLLTKLLLFHLFIILSFSAYTQKNSDSLEIDSLKRVLLTEKDDTNKVNTLNKLSEAFLNKIGDTKKAMQESKTALSLAQKLNFKRGLENSYENIGYAYLYQYNFSECRRNLFEAEKISVELGEKYNAGDYLTDIGELYFNEENDQEALRNLYDGLKFLEESGDKTRIAYCNRLIADVNIEIGNYSEALKNALVALKIYEETRNKNDKAVCYNTIGNIYFNQGNYDEALQKYLSLITIWKESSLLRSGGFNWLGADTYANIGNVYTKKGDLAKASGNKIIAMEQYTEALKNYTVSLASYENIERKDGITAAYINLGNINLKLGKIVSAKNYLEKSLKLAKNTSSKLGFKFLLRDSYLGLSSLDSVQGDYKKAYDHYKLFIVYRDSLINEENTKKSLQSKMQYEFDKKESASKAVQDKKDTEAKRIKNQQYIAIAFLGIIVLAVVIIAVVQFRSNRHKQKANLLLHDEKQKVESTLTELKSTQAQLIQSEKMASLGELTAGIAHEIQNPLNFVNNFSEVNKEMIEELQTELKDGNVQGAIDISNDIKENEEKINHHGKRADAIVKGMLQHSRKSEGVKEPTDINVLCEEYLRLSYHGIRAKDKNLNCDFKTDFDEKITKTNIVAQDIGRVMLNLFNNAFYAVNEKAKLRSVSYEPYVTVRTKKLTDKIQISVKDNGNGIPQDIVAKIFQPFFTTKPTGQGTGLGLSLSYDIIKAHGGEIRVETNEGEGSEFIIQLPNI